MNIKPKYKPGIALKPGKYDIYVTHPGYVSKRMWVEIKEADLSSLNCISYHIRTWNKIISLFVIFPVCHFFVPRNLKVSKDFSAQRNDSQSVGYFVPVPNCLLITDNIFLGH
jgi:hypothetical protein